MAKKKRVLIFYSKVGGGHESLAFGLKERLEKRFPNKLTIHLIDPLTSVIGPAYQFSVFMNFYDLFYKFTQKTLTQRLINRINFLLHEAKVKTILTRYKPDLILSTHFLFSGEVKEVIWNQGLHTPVVVYIADPFSSHPVWFTGAVDLFLSFDLLHLPNLASFGVSLERIIPIGMPVRQAFYKHFDRAKTLERLDLSPAKFTVLFGGSGLGMDRLERLAKPIHDLNLPIQGIFLCGRNKLLKKALSLLFADQPNMKILGYIEDASMAEIMQSADLFVGKAGPNIMFECILSNLPLIATPPILGQEKGNREFIRKQKIGFLSESTNRTITTLKHVVKHPQLIDTERNTIRRIRENLIKEELKGFKTFSQWIEEKVIRK